MKKRKIFSLAPHERFNYGDIMYSIILKEIFKDDDLYHLGINKGDFTDFGSGKMCDINILKKVKDEDDNLLFIGGGEFLGCTYDLLFSFIRNPKPFDKNDIFKTPFIHDEFVDELPIKKCYISFGGHTNTYSNRDFKQLGKGDIIYTRDRVTNSNVKKRIKGKEILNLPDLVTLSSYFFPRENKREYITIQLGKYKTPNVNKIIELIVKLQNDNHKIKLIGLGNCPKHDDDVILEQVFNKLEKKDNVELIKPKDALEIMNVISGSKLCIGTSLHLMITSFSYNIPWVNYNSKLAKITNYKNEWYNRYGMISNGSDLIKKVYSILGKGVDMSPDINKQQNQIINFFNVNFSQDNSILIR